MPGAFLDLIVEAVAQGFAPAEVMALLKHPLTRLGLEPFKVRRAARALEIAAFRGPYLGRGSGWRQSRARARQRKRVSNGHGSRALLRLFPEDMAGADDLVARLESGVTPLADALRVAQDAALQALHRCALEVARRWWRSRRRSGADGHPELWTWERRASKRRNFFAGILDPRAAGLAELPAADYADLYRSLVAERACGRGVAVHPRLFIWGPFEARLQQTDVVILGSLNDGTWPESADPGPWLNRPMRAKLGLPSPEEKLGYAAHDFTSFAGAPKVYLTRA